MLVGRDVRQDPEVSSTKHSLTLYYAPGTGLDATLGEEAVCQMGLLARQGSVAVPFSILDSVFVESEDLFDRTVVFPSPKSHSSMELGSRREGSGRGSGFSPPL